MYLLHISFIGTDIHGWQIQNNDITFQGILRKAFEKIFKSTDIPNPTGCSRTDADVHAIEYIATMKAVLDIPPDNLRKGLNSLLPKNIRVKHVERHDGFQDARAFVYGKHYRYIIFTGPTVSPFISKLVWHSTYSLNLQHMQKAAKQCKGTHDFSCFQAANTQIKTTVRTIHQIRVEKFENYLVIDVVGDGFLKHMVRIISGTLVQIGRGRIDKDDMSSIIASRNRDFAGSTLPGKGLFLYKLFPDKHALESYTLPHFEPNFIW